MRAVSKLVSRRTRRVVFLIIILANLAWLHQLGYFGSTTETTTIVDITVVTGPEQSSPTSPWCLANECTKGHWAARSPPYSTLEEYSQAHGKTQGYNYCRPIPDKTAPTNWTEAEKQAAGEKRFLEVANWEWQPERGQMKPFDADDLAVRLLRSPGGLILVGDSISGQHADGIINLLNEQEIYTESNVTGLPRHSERFIHRWTLNRGYPKTRTLLERAGVPASRLERPIVTWIEEHLLLSKNAIMEVTIPLGGRHDYTWYHTPARVADWEDYVEEMTILAPGEEETVTGETLVVLNTGPHWSRGLLDMLPNRESMDVEQDYLLAAYTNMVERVTSRISNIPNMAVYYRSTGPGHPVCSKASTHPYPSSLAALLAERDVPGRLGKAAKELYAPDVKKGDLWALIRARWDWDRFNIHSKVWERKIGVLMQRREALMQSHGRGWNGAGLTRWSYLDHWEMDLMRVDAHSEPENDIDCLHWCMPSVLHQWTFSLYHRIVEDEEILRNTATKRFERPPLVVRTTAVV